MKLNLSRHYIFFAERTVGNEAVSYGAYCLRILWLMKLAFYLAVINLPELR